MTARTVPSRRVLELCIAAAERDGPHLERILSDLPPEDMAEALRELASMAGELASLFARAFRTTSGTTTATYPAACLGRAPTVAQVLRQVLGDP